MLPGAVLRMLTKSKLNCSAIAILRLCGIIRINIMACYIKEYDDYLRRSLIPVQRQLKAVQGSGMRKGKDTQ